MCKEEQMRKSNYFKIKPGLLAEARGHRVASNVAKELGVHRSTLSQWEKGKKRISEEDLVKLSGFYGKQPKDFLPDLFCTP